MKLSFHVDATLRVGISRLADILGFTEGEGGIAVTAEQGERMGVSNALVANEHPQKLAERFGEVDISDLQGSIGATE